MTRLLSKKHQVSFPQKPGYSPVPGESGNLYKLDNTIL